MSMIFNGDVRAFVNTLARKPWAEDTGKHITGVVTRAGAVFPRARVWLINRRTGAVVATTSSDAAGHYIFRSVDVIPDNPLTDGYLVIGFDDTQTYDPEAKDFLQPEDDV